MGTLLSYWIGIKHIVFLFVLLRPSTSMTGIRQEDLLGSQLEVKLA